MAASLSKGRWVFWYGDLDLYSDPVAEDVIARNQIPWFIAQ